MRLPSFIVNIGKVILAYLIALSLFRLVFLVKYWPIFQNHAAPELVRSLLYGLRFDISITLILLLPYWLTTWIPFLETYSMKAKVLKGIVLLPLVAGFTILFADLVYYGDAGRRLSYEVFRISSDIPSILGIIRYYSLLLIGLGTLSIFFTIALVRLTHPLQEKTHAHTSRSKKLACHFIYLVIVIIGVRGGLQSKPLRPSFAYLIGDPVLAHLSLNPVYTVFYALKKGDILIPEVIPRNEAIQRVQDLVQSNGMTFKNPKYPLLQSPDHEAPVSPNNLNIVIMILEGWPAKYIGVLGGQKGITPQFDRLAENGVLFKNFFAISHRSTNGIAATLCSLPTFEDMQIMNTSLEQNNYRCLGEILSEQGYSTLFMHGAKTGSFGLNAFSRLAGFKRYLGKEDFNPEKSEVDPTWGLFDHIALKHLNNELKNLSEPFGATWFSLTTHTPFHLPSEKYRVTNKSSPDHELIDTLKYADESLGNFFEEAENAPYFKNTIFIILADHTSGTVLKGTKERQHIPCLIYSPSHLSPQTIEAPGGQLDIVPTVLDLLKWQTPHHSFGRSLMDSSLKNRFVFIDRGGFQGWFRGEDLLLRGPTEPIGVFKWERDPFETKNLITEMPRESAMCETELLSFIQTAKTLMRDNRLSPNY